MRHSASSNFVHQIIYVLLFTDDIYCNAKGEWDVGQVGCVNIGRRGHGRLVEGLIYFQSDTYELKGLLIKRGFRIDEADHKCCKVSLQRCSSKEKRGWAAATTPDLAADAPAVVC